MFMCRVCNKQCNDRDSVICDICRSPVHVDNCAALSSSEVDCVRSKRRKLHFFCPKCDLINVVSNLNKEFEELKSEIAELRSIIKTDRVREVGNNDNDFTEDFEIPEADDQNHGMNNSAYDRPEAEFDTFNEPTINDSGWDTIQDDQSNIEVKSEAQLETQNLKETTVENGDVTMEYLLPQKSKGSYRKVYNKFLNWRSKNNIQKITEPVILNYMDELSKTVKPSSLWSYCSMLKSCLSAYENTNIGGFPKVKALLKETTKIPKTKKPKCLSREQVLQFLYKASDEVYILEKVVLVMGIAGGCRISELVNIKVDDVDDRGNVLVVTLPDAITNKTRTFTVINEPDMKPIDVYRKYLQLRPNYLPHKRLFLNYRDGKCTVQPVGLCKLGKIPSVIASFLGLAEPHLYTGHAFKRSSALFSAENGASQREIQRRGGWSSNIVEENSVVDSIEEKIETDDDLIKSECTSPNSCVTSSSGMLIMSDEGASTASTWTEEYARNVKLEPSSVEEYNVVVEG